jgi:glycosyltransferase involved in cell wall biosynthesis
VDEASGILFAAGDGAALTAALGSLVDTPDLRRRLGQQAREHVAPDATWAARGRRLARALERVVAGTRARGRLGDAVSGTRPSDALESS